MSQGQPHRFLASPNERSGMPFTDLGKTVRRKGFFWWFLLVVEIKSLVSKLGSESNFTVYPVAVIKLTLQNAHRSMTCARLTFSSSWISKV